MKKINEIRMNNGWTFKGENASKDYLDRLKRLACVVCEYRVESVYTCHECRDCVDKSNFCSSGIEKTTYCKGDNYEENNGH